MEHSVYTEWHIKSETYRPYVYDCGGAYSHINAVFKCLT